MFFELKGWNGKSPEALGRRGMAGVGCALLAIFVVVIFCFFAFLFVIIIIYSPARMGRFDEM